MEHPSFTGRVKRDHGKGDQRFGRQRWFCSMTGHSSLHCIPDFTFFLVSLSLSRPCPQKVFYKTLFVRKVSMEVPNRTQILGSNLFLSSCLCPFLLSRHLHHFPRVSHSHAWPCLLRPPAQNVEPVPSLPDRFQPSALRLQIVNVRGLELRSRPAGTEKDWEQRVFSHTTGVTAALTSHPQGDWISIPEKSRGKGWRSWYLAETGRWNTDISIHSIPPKWPWKGQDINPQN